ncbi:hypothetical protein ACFFSH_40025, partial [Streptomyces filamentosus]
MQQVVDGEGHLAVKTRRALANVARLAGDFPTALAAVPILGWKGRYHRVLGDIHWSHADTAAAIHAFEAGRAEAEQHAAASKRAMMQVRLALAVSFADPARAADELALAHQLLEGLDQRSNTLLAQVVALIKDAGTSDRDIAARAESLRTDIETAGLPFLHRFVELALAFHHAVRGDDQDLAVTIGRLRTLTATGDFAYFTDITHFMAGLPLPAPSTTRWTRSEDDVRSAWRGLVQTRQERLLAESCPCTRLRLRPEVSGRSRSRVQAGHWARGNQPASGRCPTNWVSSSMIWSKSAWGRVAVAERAGYVRCRTRPIRGRGRALEEPADVRALF